MKQKFSVRDLVLIAFFAALTSLLAYISIPMPGGLPPITGQSFAVMLAGLLLGATNGAMSQVIYLLLGVSGLPVFANGTAGVGVLAGPTGGFIWGFVLGAFVVGKLTEKHRRSSLAFLIGAAAVGGIITVYLPGILQLAGVLNLSVGKAVSIMLPYLPGDIIKVFISAVLAAKIRPAITAGRH